MKISKVSEAGTITAAIVPVCISGGRKRRDVSEGLIQGGKRAFPRREDKKWISKS